MVVDVLHKHGFPNYFHNFLEALGSALLLRLGGAEQRANPASK